MKILTSILISLLLFLSTTSFANNTKKVTIQDLNQIADVFNKEKPILLSGEGPFFYIKNDEFIELEKEELKL